MLRNKLLHHRNEDGQKVIMRVSNPWYAYIIYGGIDPVAPVWPDQFLQSKNEIPFYKKKVINKCAIVMFRLVGLIIIS